MIVFHFLKNIAGIQRHKSVRILMYHQVLPQSISFKNDLVVTAENLEEQFKYIKEHFNPVFFKDVQENTFLKNKIIITFDDGYYNNLQYAIPLLEKYRLKATIFIPTKLIEDQDNSSERYLMKFEELQALPSEYIEIALHSHSHTNYTQLTLEEAENDLLKNMEVLKKHHIPFTKVLAYPYGKFPKGKTEKKLFFSMLEKLGIMAALRIGNNIETFPWKNKFEINRINIKYSDSLKIFKWKLRLGKLKF
ncbi:polysaccharide deacetylase family protein [Chryseobacterium sp. GMJ5]|uniref:Polysaccharide deacetylase family protein n=1 Tax=Chryseobacterium gilvum TaxID=2976534 RepID=A0ABT2VZF1_9FLAO|nr:polysaccharide deacetylase family protein [Chryseobacterium gilvum]MCU7615385.1 polysaccharide deacetylase family protein [Chryseobacterium gilvum]